MSLTEFIGLYKEKIYSKICDYMPSDFDYSFSDMVRCYVDRKGQFRRPAYLLLWNKLYGGDPEKAIMHAAVEQTCENWILMHDDWEDEAPLRRGLPSAHVLYGDKNAINAGDVLHAINWRMIKEAADLLAYGADYYNNFYSMMLSTGRGQYKEFKLTILKDINGFSKQDYYDCIRDKTSFLCEVMQAGAITAGKSLKEARGIESYAVPAGCAFQIMDDLLDCTSDPKNFGKKVGSDVLNGNKTLILWNFVSKASPADLERVAGIYAKNRKDKTQEEMFYVLDKFKQYGCYEDVRFEAESLVQHAVNNFNNVESQKEDEKIKDLCVRSIDCVHNS